MKNRNKEADKLVRDFCKVTGYDIHDRSRKTQTMLKRSLLYHVLNKENNMNDQAIEDYLCKKKVKADRSSIYHSMSKLDMYYENFDYFKTVYDTYFDDKKKSLEEVKLKIDSITLNKDKKAIYELIDDLSDTQLSDIREMIGLRIKSYAWKTSL